MQETPISETILLTGGDGTINHFINRLEGCVSRQQIYYYPSGSGNDFMNDVREEAVVGFVLLNPYLSRLPVVEVKGQMVSVLTGHDITVRFDQPTPLQIDGETIPDVLEYHVTRPE